MAAMNVNHESHSGIHHDFSQQVDSSFTTKCLVEIYYEKGVTVISNLEDTFKLLFSRRVKWVTVGFRGTLKTNLFTS